MAPARGAWLKARARSNSKIQAGERRGRCIGPEEETKIQAARSMAKGHDASNSKIQARPVRETSPRELR